jgi:soluble lytic murein transglycosylase-like protein
MRRLDRIAKAILWTVGIGVLLLVAAVVASGRAEAATPQAVPEVSTVYRLRVEREAARNFGLEAPAARLAAQIDLESGWNPKAASAYAQGLTQFTPATARWLPTICPAVGEPDAWDPDWSLRAQACYMAWLLDELQPYRHAGAMSTCTHWNFALRSYNGGLGWINRERLATQRAGDDANDWLDVERHRLRAAWAHRENTRYPRRILLVLEPRYLAAGWPGSAAC